MANESPSTQDSSWASDLQVPKVEPPKLLTWLSIESSAALPGFTSPPCALGKPRDAGLVYKVGIIMFSISKDFL